MPPEIGNHESILIIGEHLRRLALSFGEYHYALAPASECRP